jgi:hypothetical protein
MVESNLLAHNKSQFSGGTMPTPRIRSAAIALAALMMLAGCSHKLVATPGQTQVSIYPDENTYKKLSQMKAEGGVAGMLSGMGENLATGKLDDQTPVKIISGDDLGSNIEVSVGPSKGMKGFVPKANVD